MNIGIIGGGAIGLLVSYNLSKSHDTTLYVRRKEQLALISENGIHQIDDDIRIVDVEQFENVSDHELLIICVKSNDIAKVIEVLSEQKVKTPLLFLQNGMGHVSFFPSLKNELYVGVVEHGVVRANDFTFDHLGKGQIKISSVNHLHKLKTIASELTNNQFIFQMESDWQLMLKEKLIANAVINPLTALFDVQNRFIIENLYIKKIAKQLCKEVANILQLDSEQSWLKVKKIAENTGKNTSSMRSDILNKRKTEVEAILGYLLSIADDEPALIKMMYESIKALQERNQS